MGSQTYQGVPAATRMPASRLPHELETLAVIAKLGEEVGMWIAHSGEELDVLTSHATKHVRPHLARAGVVVQEGPAMVSLCERQRG